MHKLEQFVDDRFQKLPVSTKKSGILTDDVHNVGGDYSLVVFAPFLFTQSQEI